MECVTPLLVGARVRVEEATCEPEGSVREIGAAPARWYLARFRRTAVVHWTEPPDSVAWDEVVLFSRIADADSVTPRWHLMTERAIEVTEGVVAQPRAEGILLEVSVCVTGTAGCAADYLLMRGDTLTALAEPFVDALAARLPSGLSLHKGMRLDLQTLKGVWPVAAPGDGNCCPSAAFDFQIRLIGLSLVLMDARLRRNDSAFD